MAEVKMDDHVADQLVKIIEDWRGLSISSQDIYTLLERLSGEKLQPGTGSKRFQSLMNDVRRMYKMQCLE